MKKNITMLRDTINASYFNTLTSRCCFDDDLLGRLKVNKIIVLSLMLFLKIITQHHSQNQSRGKGSWRNFYGLPTTIYHDQAKKIRELL